MENTTEHKTNAPIEERRRFVARWLTEHVKPAARVLAELAEAKEVEPSPEIEIREYQLDAWANLWDARQAGKKRSLVHLATGLGKTFVAVCDVMKYRQEWAEMHGDGTSPRFLFISHKNEIQEQAAEDFLSVMPELDIDMFETQREGSPEDVDMRFASFQAILSEKDKFDPQDYEYIIYDEAHHTEAETFREIRDYFDPLFELALTATPRRMDELDITEYFGQPVYSKDLPEAMAEGLVADVEYHIMLDDAVREAIESGFDPKTLAELYELMRVMPRNEKIAEHIREEQRKQGEKAKTIVFCQDVDHAESMAIELDAIAYHSKMPKKVRRQILKDFRSGKIRTVCTRDMFNEGINIPDATILAFTRMTGSEAVFFQQLGRGLRGRNKRVTVLDFVANVERIARLRELSEAVRRHAEERGEVIKDPLDDIEGSGGMRVSTNHTKFDFDKIVIDLLARFGELQARNAYSDFVNLTNDEIVELALQISSSAPLSQLAIRQLSKEKRFISAGTIEDRFGSLSGFHRACGFEAVGKKRHELVKATNDELVALARELKPDGPLTKEEIDGLSKERSFISSTAIVKRFGSIKAFREACGFEGDRVSSIRSMTNSDIVALALSIKPSAPLNDNEIVSLSANKEFVSVKSITTRFGSISAFQAACGFEPTHIETASRVVSSHFAKMTDDQLITLALEIKPGAALTQDEISDMSKANRFASVNTVKVRFGSIANFQRSCGFETISTARQTRDKILATKTDEEIVALALNLKPSGALSQLEVKEFSKQGKFISSQQIAQRFGSLVEFQKACGFGGDKKSITRLTSSEDIVALALEIRPDSPLNSREIDELSKAGKFASTAGIIRRFGSVADFQRACGFEPSDRRVASRQTTKEDLVAAALRIKPNAPLRASEIDELSKSGDFVSTPVIRSRFGSLAAFHEACGFKS